MGLEEAIERAKVFRCCTLFSQVSRYRSVGGVAAGCFVGIVVFEVESKTARPQAAGTDRYHLPFTVADETR